MSRDFILFQCTGLTIPPLARIFEFVKNIKSSEICRVSNSLITSSQPLSSFPIGEYTCPKNANSIDDNITNIFADYDEQT